MQEFLTIGIVGAVLSGIVAMAKSRFGVNGYQAKILTVVLSLLVGGGYVWIRSTPFFETFILVLTSASTVYAMLRK